MGRPTKVEDFEELQIAEEPDLKAYVSKSILDEYIKDGIILVVLEGYGRYNVEVENC